MAGDAQLPAPKRRIPVRLVLFGLVAVASFALGFLTFSVGRSKYLIEHFGYAAISVTFAWGLFAWWRLRAAVAAAWRGLAPRQRWALGLVIGTSTVIAVLTVPAGYKILYDEMVLQATAADMHLFREVSTVMRAYTVDGVFVPLDTYLDKRPFFYPYLVSLVHDLLGYRESNAFAVNTALMPVVLLQAYFLARRVATHPAALAAVVALGTLSTLAHSATGAGMETLNLVMLLLTMQCSLLYLDAPDETRLAAVVLSAVLLAESRYESSLFVGPVALVALEGWRRSGRIIMPVAAILAPALLIPYAIHNTYLSGTPALWELRENAQTRFALDNLGPNLHHAVLFFFNLGRGLTNSFWLSTAGGLALGFAGWRLARAVPRWRTAAPAAIVLGVFGLGICGSLALLMFYYWGQLDDPTVTRLSLPFDVLLAVALAATIARFDGPRRHLPVVASLAAVFAYFWSGLPANAQHTKLNTLNDELRWEREFVAALPPGDRLIITNKSSLPWTVDRISAISIDRARRRVEALRFQLENHNFREILVTQCLRPTSGNGDYEIDPIERLPDWFELKPIAEHRFGTRVDRISRLVTIGRDPTPPPAAAK